DIQPVERDLVKIPALNMPANEHCAVSFGWGAEEDTGTGSFTVAGFHIGASQLPLSCHGNVSCCQSLPAKFKHIPHVATTALPHFGITVLGGRNPMTRVVEPRRTCQDGAPGRTLRGTPRSARWEQTNRRQTVVSLAPQSHFPGQKAPPAF